MAYPFDARSVTTDDLVTRYQRGQAAAFSALFDRYQDYVYRLALMLLRNSSEAEEGASPLAPGACRSMLKLSRYVAGSLDVHRLCLHSLAKEV